MTDGVLVRGLVVDASEQPVARQTEADVLGQHLEQGVRGGDGPLGVVLRQSDLDLPCAQALHLSTHMHLATEEVDVADLQRSCLAEAKAGESAQADERTEPRLGRLENPAHDVGSGDLHRGLMLALAGEPYGHGWIGADHPGGRLIELR